ncbi:unnamed protein product [Pedinophyceae sp. YPF-701]|nr:unnamed protein product [Pedinophyceae sp. YPF-701]
MPADRGGRGSRGRGRGRGQQADGRGRGPQTNGKGATEEPGKPALQYPRLEDKKQKGLARLPDEEWKKWLGQKRWFPFPTGSVSSDRCCDIFWDMDNVPVLWGGAFEDITPRDQYEVLKKVFGDSGRIPNVAVHVVISEHKLQAYDTATREGIMKTSQGVGVHPVLGKWKGKNEVADTVIIDKMTQVTNRMQGEGNLIVLISGDNDFSEQLRIARRRDANIFLLGPQPDPITGRSCLSGELATLPQWFQYYEPFMKFHLREKLLSRTTIKRTPKKLRTLKTQTEALRELRHDESNATKIDMLIMIDATASMHKYIDAVKTAIAEDVVTAIRRRYPSSVGNVRYGILAYRDLKDEENGLKQFEVLDFTTNVTRVSEFLADLRAQGGGDVAEDVVGAMILAAKSKEDGGLLSWEQEHKVVYHVCDAPAHGAQLNNLSDLFPLLANLDDYEFTPPPGRGLPLGEAEQALRDLRQRGVEKYFFTQLDPRQTKKMAGVLDSTSKAIDGEVPDGDAWFIPDTLELGDEDKDNPSAQRLSALVGKLVGATMSVMSASVSRATAQRRMPVKDRKYEDFDNLGAVPEDAGEGASGAGGESGNAEDIKPEENVGGNFDWGHDAAAQKKWRAMRANLNQKFRRIKFPQAVQVSVARQFEGKVHGDDPGCLLNMVKQGMVIFVDGSAIKDPHDLEREYKIQVNPFDKGKFKAAFLAQEQIPPGKVVNRFDPSGEIKVIDGFKVQGKRLLVLKEYLTVGAGENSAKRYKQEIGAAAAARALAIDFNQALAEAQPGVTHKTLKYMQSCMVAWQKKQSNGSAQQIFMLEEPLLEGSFIKWSSNAGYINTAEWDAIAHAFTHWTYHYTDHELMVVDIQGVRIGKGTALVLTDPEIHCKSHPELYSPERSEFGLAGMAAFFRSHDCNELCKALELPDAEKERKEIMQELEEDCFEYETGVPLDES